MYAILPFEKQFYQQYDYQVDYVGNPLVSTIDKFQTPDDFRNSIQGDTKPGDTKPIVAVLPGSRRQEIKHMLEIMLQLVPELPEYNFVVAAVDNIPGELYDVARNLDGVSIVTNKAYELLSVANVAVVASGTASLETALFDVPQIVCYKTSWLTYWIGRMLIKVPYISLVNLIARQMVVPELIQKDFQKQTMITHLKEMLVDSPSRKAQLAGYRKVRTLLGNKKASQETAKLIVEYLQPAKLPSTY
jgi:lipid-A-disaccharide synthase